MKYLVLLLLLIALPVHAADPPIPANAVKHLPTLASELAKYWPDAPSRSVFAAQVETESCVSLKSKKCWTPFAELKTDREYGFGLGQITVTKSFDNFKAAKQLDSSLKEWQWENRYNAEYQLRTLVLMNKFNFSKFKWARDTHEQLAFMFAAYNGGVGGVLSDRSVCRTMPLCDGARWFGNVEHTSKKAKVAVKGYGLSFFQINRRYVAGMWTRNQKYINYIGE
jgi:hypothetical protein